MSARFKIEYKPDYESYPFVVYRPEGRFFGGWGYVKMFPTEAEARAFAAAHIDTAKRFPVYISGDSK